MIFLKIFGVVMASVQMGISEHKIDIITDDSNNILLYFKDPTFGIKSRDNCFVLQMFYSLLKVEPNVNPNM